MIQMRWRPWAMVTAAFLLCVGGLAAQQPESPFKGGFISADTPTHKEVEAWSRLWRGSIGEIAANNPGNVANAKAQFKVVLANADNRKLMEKVLTWYLARITWEEVQEGRVPESDTERRSPLRVAANLGDHMSELFSESRDNSRHILPPAPSAIPMPWMTVDARGSNIDPVVLELQKQLLEEVRPLCLKLVKQVLENRNLIARVNGVRVLNLYACFGQDAVAPELAALVENKDEHDGVKYHAVQGLGKLFELTREKKLFQDDQGLALYRRCATAVLQWLEKDMKHDPAVLALWSEEERLAVSFRRRAAIQALGETNRALLIDGAELGQAANRGGKIAEVLLRIVANEENTVQPPPTWTERVIAAKAVCRLDPRLTPSYQPDYALYVVARFASEMATASRDADAATWSLYASELKGGIDQMVALLPKDRDNPGTKYVQETLLPDLNPVLKHIYDRNEERTSPQRLLANLERNKPPSKEVYKPQR